MPVQIVAFQVSMKVATRSACCQFAIIASLIDWPRPMPASDGLAFLVLGLLIECQEFRNSYPLPAQEQESERHGQRLLPYSASQTWRDVPIPTVGACGPRREFPASSRGPFLTGAPEVEIAVMEGETGTITNRCLLSEVKRRPRHEDNDRSVRSQHGLGAM
jgi:hypothetical protein